MTAGSDPIFAGEALRVLRAPHDLVELCFDRKGESVNKLDALARAELLEATRILRGGSGVSGVCVTSAKETFIVGADLFEFPPLFAQSAADVAASLAAQSAVLTAFADLPVPTLAAINGLALGGGFEMALACDYRLMADTARVALPEVTLGIMPGYGGAVRLPRLIGAAAALEWISSGRQHSGAEAVAAGAVDALVPLTGLRESAIGRLREAAARNDWQSRRGARRGAAAVAGLAEGLARLKAAPGASRHFPAALAAAEFIEASAPLPCELALKREAEAFSRIAGTPAAQALVQLFINEQIVRKEAKRLARLGSRPRGAVVLGAGIMGGGIAYTSALHGIPVLLQDSSAQALQLGRQEALELLDRQVGSGRLEAGRAAAIGESIRTTCAGNPYDEAEVVIEAIVEDLRVKQSVLGSLEPRVQPGTVIASNTSSLSITELGRVLEKPERFVGMHFFNPVPVMPLVEVIRGERSGEAALATVATYAMAMGKTPVIVKDCPGFLVNRILTAYCVGFLRLIHDGADFEQVDRVMEAFGWPMGPACLQDVIGLDTGRHVFRHIADAYPARMRLDFPDAVSRMAEQGRLGRKNGSGFYRYEAEPKGKPVRRAAPEAHALLAAIQPRGRRSFADEQIVDRLMLPMVIEAAVCLDEGVASSAAAIDLALVLGLGFPRHYGGALKFADITGLGSLLERCARYAALGGGYEPTPRMREMALRAGRFHG